nr:hypothetical protein [Providencia rettgeri]
MLATKATQPQSRDQTEGVIPVLTQGQTAELMTTVLTDHQSGEGGGVRKKPRSLTRKLI